MIDSERKQRSLCFLINDICLLRNVNEITMQIEVSKICSSHYCNCNQNQFHLLYLSMQQSIDFRRI